MEFPYETFSKIMKNKLMFYTKWALQIPGFQYSFKNMLNQGSSALRGMVEMAKILSQNHASISRFYTIFDGVRACRVDFYPCRRLLSACF